LVILRCTAKLLKRLKLGKEPLKDPGPSTTALGDWYANIIYMGRQPLVLAVSERSLLSLLMPARDLERLPGHLTRTLIEKLQRMGVPETTIKQEISKMDPVIYARTASRSVLGSMTEFTSMLKYTSWDHPDQSLVDIMDWLGDTLCSPLGYQYPSEKARELLMENSLRIVN
jgi:hypothetical protein